MGYSDEWWKCGSPHSHDLCGYYTDVQPDCFSHEEWYGVMAIEDNGALPDIMHPREVYCALQQAFSDRLFPCDFDSDDNVDFNDFAIFAYQWLDADCYENNCCDGVDLDHNGMVELIDLSIFVEYWLEGNE